MEPDFSLANILSNVSVEKPFCNSNSFVFKFKTTDINSVMLFPDPGVSTCRGLSESPLQADSLAKVPHHLSSCSYICFSLPPLLDLLDWGIVASNTSNVTKIICQIFYPSSLWIILLLWELVFPGSQHLPLDILSILSFPHYQGSLCLRMGILILIK